MPCTVKPHVARTNVDSLGVWTNITESVSCVLMLEIELWFRAGLVWALTCMATNMATTFGQRVVL